MRPVRLDVEGFTSFREKQSIDFSGLDLFAITGATGAGKSSLIDALVFALYAWPQFFAFVAFLSLNLAILNFLPIPVLDGGHFFLLAVEGVIRRPLHPALIRYTNLAGATVVIFFMGFAFLNDILKMLGL